MALEKRIHYHRAMHVLRNCIVIVCLILIISSNANADSQTLIDKSAETLSRFANSQSNREQFNDALDRSKAIVIVPNLLAFSLGIGAEGGQGIILTKNSSDKWSAPAFLDVSNANFGLQIGFSDSEVIIMIQSQEALDLVLQERGVLGDNIRFLEISIVDQSNTTGNNTPVDSIVFRRNKGLFVKIISISGGQIKFDHEKTKSHYEIKEDSRYATEEDIAHFLSKYNLHEDNKFDSILHKGLKNTN